MKVVQIAFFAMTANLLVSPAAFAQDLGDFKSGVRTGFYVVFDCVHKTIPSGSGTATHGKVETELRNLPRCGQQNVPHLTYWYTPDKNYAGPDEIFLYSEGIKDRYRVNVVK